MIRSRHFAALGLATVAGLYTIPQAVFAQDDSAESQSFADAMANGTVDFNIRFRAEFVDQDGLDDAEAYTERIRIGYKTGEFEGLSFYIGFEDTRSANYDRYNASGLNGQGGRAVVADPEDTDLDQLYAKYRMEDANLVFIAGRQKILLDDQRFVGPVGWRQMEQTFDALTVKWDATEDVHASYSYVWEVNRVFGPDSGLDFDSSSHLFNVSYDGMEYGRLTGFAYLLDFDNSVANSSNTFGVLFKGKYDLNDELAIAYKLSYAMQSDAGDNTADYDADYYVVDLGLTKKDLGTIGVAYEVLGSDNGASFRTPLATGHAFNGWADVFLTTPATGLEDFSVYAKATLPGDIKGKVVYHWYEAESGGGDLGEELDFVLSKKLDDNWSALLKYASYDGDGGNADRDKIWLQTTFKF